MVDGRRRVRSWEALRNAGYWSEVLALRCAGTPADPAEDAVEELRLGEEHVDLAAALSLLVHPVLSTAPEHPWHGGHRGRGQRLELTGCERIGGLVWLRHRVSR